MSMYRKLIGVAAVATLAFGLAACGSGDDDGTAMMEPAPMPEPMPEPEPMPTAIELPAGNIVHRFLNEDSPDTMTLAAGASRVFGGLLWTCPADGPDCVVHFTDDILSASAMAPPGAGVAMVASIPNPAFGRSDLAGYLSDENVLRALRHNGTALIQGRGFDITGDSYSDTSVRAVGGTDVTLTAFPVGTDDTAIPGVALSARGGISLDLYSTAEADTTSPFNEVYGDNVTPTSYAGFWTRLTIPVANLPEGSGVQRFTPGNAPGGDATFGTTAGTLACVSGVCTIERVGTRLSGTGAWRFTPNAADGATAVSDDDYITFGWWMRAPGGVPMERDVVWAGAEPFTAANLASVRGTASYAGGAVGHYEHRASLARRIDRGTFRGTASLTANFTESRIYGSVTGLTGANDAATALLPFSVTLRNSSFGEDGTFGGGVALRARAAGTDGNLGTTDDVGADTPFTSGSWEGQFFGNGPLASTQPGAVAGEFEAWTGSPTAGASGVYMNVQAAFGAERD